MANNSIVGKWETKKIEFMGKLKLYMTFDFFEDGTCYYENHVTGIKGPDRYNVSGNAVTTVSGRRFNIIGGKLIQQMNGGNDIEFKRI